MKFVRSSLLVKVVILILAVYATVTLVSLRSQITEKNEQAAQLQSSITAAEQENDRLQNAIDSIDTDAGIREAAGTMLGMVESDEIVFYNVGD